VGGGKAKLASKAFFFEKKNQKTFVSLVRRRPDDVRAPDRLNGLDGRKSKFFASFLQKRSACLPYFTRD
jgi:hypothetical protein